MKYLGIFAVMKIKKDDIFIIAARLFRAQGFNAVSMRDLADELGIKAASLYSHISSKQQILSQIIIDLAIHFTEGMQEVIDTQKDPISKLKDVIALHVSISIEFADAIGCLNSEWMNLEEPHLSDLKRMREDYEKNVAKIIRQGIKEKAFTKMPEKVMLYTVLSTLRTLYQWKDEVKLKEKDLIRHLQKTLISGIVS